MASWTPGIDVYHGDGDQDWAARWDEGDRFAFLKLSEGVGQPGDTAAWFPRNFDAAKAAGFLVGAYHFGRAEWTGVEQAEVFAALLPAGADLCMLDLEADALTGTKMTDAEARAFAARLGELTEVHPVLYGSAEDVTRLTGTPELAGWLRFVASYGAEPSVPWDFWQWTDSGGSLDRDRFDGSVDELRQLVEGGRDMDAAQSKQLEEVWQLVRAIDSLIHDDDVAANVNYLRGYRWRMRNQFDPPDPPFSRPTNHDAAAGWDEADLHLKGVAAGP